MSFHDVRFPVDIAYGSSGGPAYSTDIVELASGYEQRNANWSAARAKYNVAHGVKTQSQLDALIAFFRARKGRAYGFRFKDWADYSASSENIGSGDGVQVDFQLSKNYQSGGVYESRNITKPVSGSVIVYLDAVAQSNGWSIDYSTGIITFSTAPASGVVVSTDFEFDVPVRFDTDRISAVLDSYGSHSWSDIPLVEVRV